MNDLELIKAAAEKVMGWKPKRTADGYDYDGLPSRCYLFVYDEDSPRDLKHEGWNPLTSDTDAFMLVDALKNRLQAAFVLGSSGYSNQHSAWIFKGSWALGRQQNKVPEPEPDHDDCLLGCATSEDRRRAIVLAALRACGVKA